MDTQNKQGYKQTEVGLIPEEWEVFTVDQLVKQEVIFQPLDGNHGELHPKKSDFVNDGIPFIMANDVYDGKIDLNNCSFIKKEQAEKLRKGFSYFGDVLFTHKGTVGNVALVENNNYEYLMLTPQVTFYRIKDKSRTINNYLKQYFQGDYFQFFIRNISGGGTRAYIGITAQRQLPVILPPLPEQTAIASALSDMDALIAQTEKLIEKKKAIKQGVMQELLTGKKRLKGFENSKGYKQTEVGVIPEDWEVLSIDSIFDFYSTSNYSKAEMSLEGEVGCIHYGLIHAISDTSYNLQRGIKFFIKPEQAKYEGIKDGDVVMVDASEDMEGVNKSIEVFGVNNKRFIAGLHTYLLRDNKLRLANNFRGAILNSSLIKNQLNRLAVGMKVFGVSKPQLKTVLIPVPPLPEQTAIASALSDMDEDIRTRETKLQKLKLQKQGMMQALLTGKIRLV